MTTELEVFLSLIPTTFIGYISIRAYLAYKKSDKKKDLHLKKFQPLKDDASKIRLIETESQGFGQLIDTTKFSKEKLYDAYINILNSKERKFKWRLVISSIILALFLLGILLEIAFITYFNRPSSTVISVYAGTDRLISPKDIKKGFFIVGFAKEKRTYKIENDGTHFEIPSNEINQLVPIAVEADNYEALVNKSKTIL